MKERELDISLSFYTPQLHERFGNLEKKLSDGRLGEIGRGGDMVAYSRPDLDFIVKFSYDDNTLEVRNFLTSKVERGLLLGQERISDLIVLSIKQPLTIKQDDRDTCVEAIIQEKVEIVRDFYDQDKAVSDFRCLARRMWSRGVLDRDPNWEENYGYTKNGDLLILDIGDLTDDKQEFSHFEGLPRSSLYDSSLRSAFTRKNFNRYWLK